MYTLAQLYLRRHCRIERKVYTYISLRSQTNIRKHWTDTRKSGVNTQIIYRFYGLGSLSNSILQNPWLIMLMLNKARCSCNCQPFFQNSYHFIPYNKTYFDDLSTNKYQRVPKYKIAAIENTWKSG